MRTLILDWALKIPVPNSRWRWSLTWTSSPSRTGAVITHERIGNYETSLDEAKEIAAAKFPDRDILGPDDPKPWDS